MLYTWYLKKQGDWDTIHKENDITEMPEEAASAKKKLRHRKCNILRAYPTYADTDTRELVRHLGFLLF